jgi:hypothetical protein
VSELALDRECRRFTRYLLGEEPSPYVVACYRRAHRASSAFAARDALDRAALRLAALPLGAGLADAHARLFAPTSALRRKLVLLLAILETSPPSYRRVDDPGPRSAVLAWGRLAWIGLSAAAVALLGSALLLPVQAVARRGTGEPREP